MFVRALAMPPDGITRYAGARSPDLGPLDKGRRARGMDTSAPRQGRPSEAILVAARATDRSARASDVEHDRIDGAEDREGR
jgi:hypothetical protein